MENTNFRESQCIRAILSPGKVNNAPIRAHQRARKNFKISFEAGPLKNKTHST